MKIKNRKLKQKPKIKNIKTENRKRNQKLKKLKTVIEIEI